MRIENIKPAAVPAYINNQENYEYMELESRANKTAAVLLTLSGLATLGLVGAGFMYNRKSGLKTFNETVKNKGIKFDNKTAFIDGEKFSGALKYITKNNLIKTRLYKDGLLSSIDTKRELSDSTRLLIERDKDGKIVSFTLKRMKLWRKPETIHTKQIRV